MQKQNGNDYKIKLNNIFFAYRNRNVLENVNLLIEKGEFASIVGPNGGGKTTLIKLILGLIKPDKGSIQVFGKSPKKARQQIGYMPQYAHLDMDFPASVMDVVLMGRLKNSNLWFSKKDRLEALNAIDELGMITYAKTGFNKLSGGQKQRVLIARALCNSPDILLLDEPTANVDHQTEENLFSTLKNLNSKMTILLVSHDLGFVSKYVKSVICVNRQVVIHPTTLMNGAIIKDIYNGDLKMVRHDHRCSKEGHNHG
ncbi:MAG: ABC transporter ATP-binding protein [Desulfobacula sp.]|jgi:zinc transport system ATP-binding protein|nr:ABC transporter ATP-binding protein [Desulfobacula sp.]MBT6337851.1 ABC transporter ATP-binding protein [Desulfobacula sp.]MBT7261506.1 ABC transporter ATP-binding protein [Desulfobacula sp.]